MDTRPGDLYLHGMLSGLNELTRSSSYDTIMSPKSKLARKWFDLLDIPTVTIWRYSPALHACGTWMILKHTASSLGLNTINTMFLCCVYWCLEGFWDSERASGSGRILEFANYKMAASWLPNKFPYDHEQQYVLTMSFCTYAFPSQKNHITHHPFIFIKPMC